MSSHLKTSKLIVEVIDARDLLPKDGQGTSSPYVILDYYGQRKRTRTVVRDLCPSWNEVVVFDTRKPSDVFDDFLELDVYHDKSLGPTSRSNFLGRLRLNSRQFVRKGEEALINYPLGKKHLFSWTQGEIGLKIYYADDLPPAPLEPTPQPAPQIAEEMNPAEVPQPEKPADGSPPPPPPPDASPPETIPPEPTTPVQPQPESDATPAPAVIEPPSERSPPPGNDPPPCPPQQASGNPVEPPFPPQDCVNHRVEPDPVPGVQPFTATRSVSDVGISRLSGPRPIPRASSISSLTSELSETVTVELSTFDLVNKMHYLFVRVVRARSLSAKNNPIVKIAVSGSQITSKPARKTSFFEWDQTFAFNRDSPDSSYIMEVSVWDPPRSMWAQPKSDVAAGHNFLGGICFDVSEIPIRDPPDSPLAPQWYRLEGGGAHTADIMLATWVGTQADESFSDAWKTDTAGNPNSRSKIYQSPKLWYLRLTVLEAQDVLTLAPSPEYSLQIRAQFGFQVMKTKISSSRNGSPSWHEDLIFVAAEPFTGHNLIIFLENRQPKESVRLGAATIELTSIERRVDNRQVASRWISLDDPNHEKRLYKGRVHLRVCFDGGYHVMDEAAHVCSDYRPTARQLWKPAVGTIELGIVGCKNLIPMKTINGKGTTDAYAVAKYGNKWVRTRAISDSLDPKWNEQYTWKVYDPSTVLTLGVFDSSEVSEINGSEKSTRPDIRIGKVRIRVSTLQTGKVYKNSYPLILLTPLGLKRIGEIELAIRFIRTSAPIDFLNVYSQPLLPLMHHIKPLGMVLQEMLRTNTVKIVIAHLARSEPPLKREVVTYMLDADTQSFSMRKVRANWHRIINVIAGVIDMVKWVEDTRSWKNPTSTILVHALLVLLVWYPDLIIPTLAFYVFAVGAWNYRFRSRAPLPHFDPKISLAESIDRDELDEEFDLMPSNRSGDVIRVRYDKLRNIGVRVQTVLGDFATQGERAQALVTWRDPRATGIFVVLCLVVAMILYLVPSKMVGMAFGFYYLRHPIFRDRMPSPALNFFRRLPSLSDRVM